MKVRAHQKNPQTVGQIVHVDVLKLDFGGKSSPRQVMKSMKSDSELVWYM